MNALITLSTELLENLFAVGMVGSVLVVILTAIGDVRTLFGSEDSNQ